MAADPYAAPRARIADKLPAAPTGNFIAEGQALAAGNGWGWIVAATEMFRRQPGMWIAIVIVLAVVLILVSMVPVVGGLAAALLGPVFAGGIARGCQDMRDGGELNIGHLFVGFTAQLGSLVMIGVFNLVASIVIGVLVVLIVGGSVFALLSGGGTPNEAPGMAAGVSVLVALLSGLALAIPTYMAIWFAPSLVMLNDFGPAQALKASFAACWKNVLPFLLYGVIMFAAAIAASIPFLLGWLVLAPLLAISVYTAYRDVFYAD